MKESIIEQLETYIQSETELQKIIVIYGPTACGKTALSIDVAKYLSSEIISTDSRQIYRYMNIGTGKITPEEMAGIRHHMIDVIDPSEKFSMVDFADMALPKIDEIIAK
jgi:tRNA dimethylallyltransferase